MPGVVKTIELYLFCGVAELSGDVSQRIAKYLFLLICEVGWITVAVVAVQPLIYPAPGESEIIL